MGIWNALFGGRQLSPEEEQQEQEAKKYDLLKYDGVKAMKIGQADYAIRCFQEALKLNDSDLEVRDYLSQVLLRKGDLDGALAQLQSMLANFNGEKAPILERIAQIAYMQEDYATMSQACEQYLQLAPEAPQAYYLHSQAFQGQGNTVAAIAMLTKAIVLKDDFAEAYLSRAQILFGMGDLNAADEDASWLIEHVGAQEDVLLLKARIEARKGNTEQALKLYDVLTEVNPFSIEAYRERGQLKFDTGDKTGAEADMQKVLELDPNQLADVSGDYSAEGIEHRVRQAYSAVNPLGL